MTGSRPGAPEPTVAFRNAPSEDAGSLELRRWLDEAVKGAIPPPLPFSPPPPVTRFWPVTGSDPNASSAIVTECHPDVAFLFPGVPVTRLRLHTPGGGWGRKKRFESRLTGRSMYAQSALEYDVFRDMELDATNCWFVEQPFRLRYWDVTRWRYARPDLFVIRPDGVECIEVKPEADASAYETRWLALGAGLQRAGMAFRVVTDRHVRYQPRLPNTRLVFRCRHEVVAPELQSLALAWLAANGKSTVGEMSDRTGLTLNQVWALARRCSVAVDLDQAPLDAATPVWLRSRTSHVALPGVSRT